MSLNGSLQIGRSAILASQAAIQVAGHNMANAATEGYHRRSVQLAAAGDELILGRNFAGTGVRLEGIRREIDNALQSRFRDASSQENAALIDQRFLTAIETLQNELSDNDLSSVLSDYFNAFSELANNPEDHAIRSLVVEQGLNLANRVASLGSDYVEVRKEVDRSLGVGIEKANDILDRIETVNQQLINTGQGGSQAHGLRDHRDLLIDELSEFLEVSVIEQPTGSVDVLVGSEPIILAGKSRGLELRSETINGELVVSIRVLEDGTKLTVNEGRIGGLLRQREQTIEPALEALDTFAAQLIFEVNRLHSQGQGQIGHESIIGTYGVADTTVAMNTDTELEFDIDNGSFFIYVTHQSSGVRTSHQVNVDGDTMSLDDLVNEINVVVAVPNVTAATSLGNVLTLTAASGYEMSFSDDTSGALAALGINTFFVGEDAATMDVLQSVQDDPQLIAAGLNHVEGSNGTAVAIADLQNTQLTGLSNKSLREYWRDSVGTLAVRTAGANDQVASTRLVRESLSAQIQSVSGVSLDEESINLLLFQRQFQAAARFIAVIDETLQTLLAMV